MAGRSGLALTALLLVAPPLALAIALDVALARSGGIDLARYVTLMFPVAALAAVAIVVHGRTGSIVRAATITLGALVLSVVTLLDALIVVWSQASGS